MIYNVDLPQHPSHKTVNQSGRGFYDNNNTVLNENAAFIPHATQVFPLPAQNQPQWIIPANMMPRNMVIPTGVNILETQRDLIMKKNAKHANFYNSVFLFLAFLLAINLVVDIYTRFFSDDTQDKDSQSRKYATSTSIQKLSHILILVMDGLWILLCAAGVCVTRYQTKRILAAYWAILIITFIEGVVSCIVQLYSLGDTSWAEKIFPLIFLIIFVLVMIWFVRFSLQLNTLLDLKRKLDGLNQLG